MGVEVVLERFHRLVGETALLPLVDEVMRSIERHGHANVAPLDHLVEVTGKRLVRQNTHGFRQGVAGDAVSGIGASVAEGIGVSVVAGGAVAVAGAVLVAWCGPSC